MTFSEKLQQLRKSKGLSQEQLASELNVSRQAISKWEQGCLPDVSNIVSISKYFSCSLDFLLDDTYDATSSHQHMETQNKNMTENKLINYMLYLGITLSILFYFILFFLSKLVGDTYSILNTDANEYYHGVCGFIYSNSLEPAVIVSTFVFEISFATLFYQKLKKYKGGNVNKIIGFVGLLMIEILILTIAFELLCSRYIIVDNVVTIVLSIYVCFALTFLLYFFRRKDIYKL